MEHPLPPDRQLWQKGLTALEAAWRILPHEEKKWILPRLEAIASLQEGMHQLFSAHGGENQCHCCLGACCARGKHHVTLVNLLAYLAQGKEPPIPEFQATCPMLGEQGCRMPAGMRPFNCISFLCEPIEGRMGAAGRDAFYAAERTLRQLYAEFEERFTGAGMRGFLLAVSRLGEDSPLSRNLTS